MPHAMMSDVLAKLTPDGAVLLLTGGVLLIYLELNRPGWVLPGAVGLLSFLLSIAALVRYNLSAGAAVLAVTGAALLLLDLRRRTPWLASAAATLALILGLDQIIASGPVRIHTSVALICGLILGVGTSLLTSIARRARTNKGLD